MYMYACACTKYTPEHLDVNILMYWLCLHRKWKCAYHVLCCVCSNTHKQYYPYHHHMWKCNNTVHKLHLHAHVHSWIFIRDPDGPITTFLKTNSYWDYNVQCIHVHNHLPFSSNHPTPLMHGIHTAVLHNTWVVGVCCSIVEVLLSRGTTSYTRRHPNSSPASWTVVTAVVGHVLVFLLRWCSRNERNNGGRGLLCWHAAVHSSILESWWIVNEMKHTKT